MNAHLNDNEKLSAFDKFYVAALFFYVFLLFAPTAYTLLPATLLIANATRLFIAGVLTVYILHQTIRWGSVTINKGLCVISFMFVFFAIIPTAYHQTTYLYLNEFTGFYLVYMFFLFYQKKYLNPLIDMATRFLMVMLILSIIGFFYALLGGSPLISGISDDDRTYFWYLTTGAVDTGIFSNLIRPSAIYDEPGGFSYVICALCFLRIFAKRSDKTTFALMFLGNITFSVIHMIIFALFIAHLALKYKMKKMFIIYAMIIFGLMIIAYIPVRNQMNEHLFARFAVSRGIGFAGNNRAWTFGNAIGLLKSEGNQTLIWGLPRDGDGLTVMDKSWIYGHNPLAPTLKFGIFVAWLYYFYLAFFSICGIIDKKHFLVYLSIFLMLIQRPEFYKGGTTAAVLLLFFTSWELIKNKQQQVIP